MTELAPHLDAEIVRQSQTRPTYADYSKFKAFVPILSVFLVSRMCIGSAVSGAMAAGGYGDFYYYYHAADRLQHHQVLYPPPFGGFYVYSPLLAQLLRPLSRHPIQQALHEWSILCAGCLAISALLSAICRDIPRAARWIAFPAMMLLGFRFWPTTLNFDTRQANLPLVLLVTAMTWTACRRWHYGSALFLVAFALMKTWGIGLFLYFILTRQWKALLLGVVAFVTSLTLLFTNLQPGEFARFIKTTRLMAVQPELISQSIVGFARAHFGKVAYIEPITRNSLVYYSFVIFCLAILLAGVWWVFRQTRFTGMAQHRLLICFTVNTLLLILPLCHKEYSVLYIPSIWAILCVAPKNVRGVAIWFASLATYLLFFTIAWPNGVTETDHYSKWTALRLNMDFFGGATLWLLCLATLILEQARVAKAQYSSREQHHAIRSIVVTS